MKGHGGQGSLTRFLLLQWAGLFFDHDIIISSIMRTKVLTVKRGNCRDLLQEVGQEEPEETVSDVSAG